MTDTRAVLGPQDGASQGTSGSAAEGGSFDAFISYSQRSDRLAAALLNRELQRFTKPWYRLRSLRVFQDASSLAAAPELWGAIEGPLARSEWLILLASPESVASQWVEKEVTWWLQNRSAARLLIVLTDGEIVWSELDGDFDWTRTTAVGRYLTGVFSGEPLWVDLRWLRAAGEDARSDARLQDSVGAIAAAIKDVDKDVMVGEHLRQHRRTLRIARTAIITLSLLLVVALVAAQVAYTQRNEARRQARIALAGQLAATSDALLAGQLNDAMLLAAQGYSLLPSARTRSALFRAVTSSPALVRYLPAGSRITALAADPQTVHVAAGTEHGDVWVWPDIHRSQRTAVTRLSHAVTAIALSRDGRAGAAAGAGQLVRWHDGTPQPQPLTLPAGEDVKDLSMSPTGQTLAVLSGSPNTEQPTAHLSVFTGTQAPVVGDLTDMYVGQVAVPTDDALLLIGSGWTRWRLPDLRLVSEATFNPGVHSGVFGASVDRRWLQFTLGDNAYFWSTRRSGELDLKNADRVARSVGAFAEAVAISNSGTRAVVSNAGQMYSSSAVPPTGGTSSVLEREALTGNARVTDRGLSFAGADDDTLVAAVGDNLALWKLDQAGRTDTPASVDISYGCLGCVNSPAVSLPPDGKAVTIDAVDHKTSVSDLTTGKTVTVEPDDGAVTAAAWVGGRLVVSRDSAATPPRNGLELWDPWPVPHRIAEWSWPPAAPPPQQLFVSADQKTVAGVNESTVAFYDAASGHQLRTVTLPVPADGTVPGVRQLAMSPSLNLVSYIDARESDGRVHVFRLSDQHDQTIHGPVPASADYPSGGSVAFAGDDTLLIMGQTGTLEAWDLHTFKRRWGLSTPIPRGVVRGSEDGRWAVVRYQDAVLRLYDVESGELVAPVPTPGPDDGRTGYAFSGDSHYLAIAVEGGIVHRISVQPQDWVRAACTAAGRTLTAEDRQRLTGATQLGSDPCSR